MTSPINKDWEKSIVINDIHIPFHDPKVIKLLFRFIKWFKPKKVFINGDLLDCWAISKFDKNPKDGTSLNDEIRIGRKFLQDLRALDKDMDIIWIYGNHEYRFQQYLISQAPELIGLNGLSLAEQMNVKDYGVKVVFSGLKESFIPYGRLYIGHYNKVAKHGGYTVKSLIDDKGVSVIQGHTHRFGSHLRTLLDGTVLGGWENACLCSLRPNYVLNPNWQHGFSVVWKKKNGRFMVEQVPIIHYKFFYGGVEWK